MKRGFNSGRRNNLSVGGSGGGQQEEEESIDSQDQEEEELIEKMQKPSSSLVDVRQASEMISTGDEPLWSLQRSSLEDVIVEMGNQRNQMDKLLGKISKAISKKQQNNISVKVRYMDKLSSEDIPDGESTKKGHIAEQLADKMKQMASVNERFIEQQLKDIKQLDYQLKKQVSGESNERISMLDEQINELRLEIEKELHGIAQRNALQYHQINEPQPVNYQLNTLDESQKKILQETESNLARAKGLNQKLQERTLHVDADILSTQMELIQLKEYQEQQQQEQQLHHSASPPSKSKSPHRVKQIHRQISLPKRYAEKTIRKEVLEKQIAGNEQQTEVNLKRYDKLIKYLKTKSHQNDGLLEQFKQAMGNASQHLLRVSQLAASLDEVTFKAAFPKEFKQLKAFQENHSLNGEMSYWELKTHSPSQLTLLSMSQLGENDEGDDFYLNKSQRHLEKSDSKRRSFHLHRKNDVHSQQQQQGLILKSDSKEVIIKRQQNVLEQLQLQLLDQTKQSEFLQLQLQMQQHQQGQLQSGSVETEKQKKIDFYGGGFQQRDYESFRKSSLKLPKLGDQRESSQSSNSLESQHRRDNSSQMRQINHHLQDKNMELSTHPQGSQKRSQSVVQHPGQKRHLRINTQIQGKELYDFNPNPRQYPTTTTASNNLQSTFVYNSNHPALSRNLNSLHQSRTLSSLNNEDALSRQQELLSNSDEYNDVNSQMDILGRRSSSQKRILKRKNQTDLNNPMDSTLSLIDASCSPVRQQQTNNNNEEQYNQGMGNTTNSISPGMIFNSNNDKSLILQGLPGTKSSFSNIVWEATEKKKHMNGIDNESQETRNAGHGYSENRKITDMNDTLQLSKYMERGLNEQAMSYKPTGKQQSFGKLNQSYGVVTRVSTQKVDEKQIRTSIASLKQSQLDPNLEKLNDQNSNISRLGQEKEVTIRDYTREKDKNENNAVDVGRSVQIVKKLLESSSDFNHTQNTPNNQRSTLTPFIEKRYTEDKPSGLRNLNNYAAFNDNHRGLRRKIDKRPSQVIVNSEDTMEDQSFQRNQHNRQMKFNQQEIQNDDGRDEKQEILEQLAEERREKGKLKEMLKREENDKEMLLQQLQQQQMGLQQQEEQFYQQNEGESPLKDRRISRGKVTWKDSERGKKLYNSQIRDGNEGNELRYLSRQRGQGDSLEMKKILNGQVDQESQQRLQHYGSNLSPKSSLKWRRSQQLLEYQSPKYNNQMHEDQQRSSEQRKRNSYGFKQGTSQQQVSEFVSFLDAQRALQGQSKEDKEEDEYCRYDDRNQNDIEKSPLRNRIEKKVNFKQFD